MSEKGIPMIGAMVRATLREVDPKTQTRRVVKPQPMGMPPGGYRVGDALMASNGKAIRCPYGAPGDKLWVREAYRFLPGLDAHPPRDVPASNVVRYEATADPSMASPRWGRYRHARFMPRWASRITLEVTGVRVERLQDISEADAIAEGVEPINATVGKGRRWKHYLYPNDGYSAAWEFASNSYSSLWESINGADSWDANPLVWVVEFKRVKP